MSTESARLRQIQAGAAEQQDFAHDELEDVQVWRGTDGLRETHDTRFLRMLCGG